MHDSLGVAWFGFQASGHRRRCIVCCLAWAVSGGGGWARRDLSPQPGGQTHDVASEARLAAEPHRCDGANAAEPHRLDGVGSTLAVGGRSLSSGAVVVARRGNVGPNDIAVIRRARRDFPAQPRRQCRVVALVALLRLRCRRRRRLSGFGFSDALAWLVDQISSVMVVISAMSRGEVQHFKAFPLRSVGNQSINQSINRSILPSFTTQSMPCSASIVHDWLKSPPGGTRAATTYCPRWPGFGLV